MEVGPEEHKQMRVETKRAHEETNGMDLVLTHNSNLMGSYYKKSPMVPSSWIH